MKEDERGRLPLWVILGLVAVVAGGLFFRVYNLEREAAFQDEAASLTVLDEPTLGGFFRSYRLSGDVVSPPAYFVLEYYWARVAGNEVARVRLLSILLGTAALVMVFLLGSEVFGYAGGLGAAALAASSIFFVYYSQEIRAYALVLLLASTSAYAFIRVLAGGGRRWWAVNIVANGLLPAAHLITGLVLVVQGICLLVCQPRAFRRLVVWGALNAMALAPMGIWVLAMNRGAGHNVTSWMEPPGLGDLLVCLEWFSGGLTALFPRSGFMLPAWFDTAAGWGVVLAVGTLAVLGVWRLAVGKRQDERGGQEALPQSRAVACFLVLWLVLPPLALFGLSYVWRPCFVERYVIHSALPLLILAGGGLASLRGRRSLVAASALAVVFGYQLTLLSQPLRSDWHSIGAYVDGRAGEGEHVFVAPFWQRDSFRFYSDLPDAQVHSVYDWPSVYARAGALLADGDAFWLVVWPVGEDLPSLEAELASHGMALEKVQTVAMIPPVIYRITPGARPRTP